MPINTSTLVSRILDIHQDCLMASKNPSDVLIKLRSRRIAVTGGTGFLGTWIAEMVATINEEYGLDVTLDLYSRHTAGWKMKYPHLSDRRDINLHSQDVRSPFEFDPAINFVIHAAGIPNKRVHSSDPIRVESTIVEGIKNTLEAASKLNNLNRFLNVSSGSVSGAPTRPGGISEIDYFPIPSGQLHLVYADAKRAAESIATIYRNQFRMPISTIRPFTFAGPYQALDRPWAFNSFLLDVLMDRDIRIHGEGGAIRSYLYGSDAAWWTMVALVNGADGATYNFGGSKAITHLDLVELICKNLTTRPSVTLNSMPSIQSGCDDFYPNIEFTQKSLGVSQTCLLPEMIDKTLRWHALSIAN